MIIQRAFFIYARKNALILSTQTIEMLNKIPKFIRNKYTVTTLTFLVWIMFLDNFDVFTLITNINQRDSKRTEQVRLQSEIDKTKRKLHELTSDPEQLEKFARENYLMKRDNEDVFVIVVEEEQ